MDDMCEWCSATDIAIYAHQADAVCASCLRRTFGLSEAAIHNAPSTKPPGATYQDVWLITSSRRG